MKSFVKWIFLKTGYTYTFHLLTVRFSIRIFKFQSTIIVQVSHSWLLEYKEKTAKIILNYEKGRTIIKGNEILVNNFVSIYLECILVYDCDSPLPPKQ